jgi:hypothetical protein
MLPQVMLRRGGSCFRVEHLLLCGIPNLETIKQKQMNSVSKPSNQQTSGTKYSSTKCFQQTRICLVILFPIFNLIFHIFSRQMLTASQPNSLKYSIRLWWLLIPDYFYTVNFFINES